MHEYDGLREKKIIWSKNKNKDKKKTNVATLKKGGIYDD